MENLIFATGNEHKASEVRKILYDAPYNILTLSDIGYQEDIAETGDTFAENASIKAKTIYETTSRNVFADDSGLEVWSLDMAPGIYTARYAGDQKNDDDNIDKLLDALKGVDDRRARFVAVMAVIIDGQLETFEGIVNGTIADQRMGEGGFGYDPIFIPEGYDQSFAQLDDGVKNLISHRYHALYKMGKHLQESKKGQR